MLIDLESELEPAKIETAKQKAREQGASCLLHFRVVHYPGDRTAHISERTAPLFNSDIEGALRDQKAAAVEEVQSLQLGGRRIDPRNVRVETVAAYDL